MTKLDLVKIILQALYVSFPLTQIFDLLLAKRKKIILVNMIIIQQLILNF